jgi:hypothetical protein
VADRLMVQLWFDKVYAGAHSRLASWSGFRSRTRPTFEGRVSEYASRCQLNDGDDDDDDDLIGFFFRIATCNIEMSFYPQRWRPLRHVPKPARRALSMAAHAVIIAIMLSAPCSRALHKPVSTFTLMLIIAMLLTHKINCMVVGNRTTCLIEAGVALSVVIWVSYASCECCRHGAIHRGRGHAGRQRRRPPPTYSLKRRATGNRLSGVT